MKLFNRLKTGFLLSIASLRVLRSHPKLMLYPLISGIASIVFLLALLGPLFLASNGFSEPGAFEAIALFVVYLGTTYIASLFNAGLVYSVREVFRGNEPSVGEGLRAASSHSGTLFIWAFVSAIVGVFIQALESQDGIGAQIAAMIFSVGWTVMTFFVLPVIVFEDATGKSMFTRSASIFKETWGETAGANVGLGIVPALIAIPGIAIAVGIVILSQSIATIVTAVAIALVAIVVSILVGGVITGVAKTALYVYATESIEPDEFRQFDFDALFPSDSKSDSSRLSAARRGI